MRSPNVVFEIRWVEQMWALTDLTHDREVGVFTKLVQAKAVGECLCDLSRPAALIIVEHDKQTDARFYPSAEQTRALEPRQQPDTVVR